MQKEEAEKQKLLEEEKAKKLAEEAFLQNQTLGLPETKSEASNNQDSEKTYTYYETVD